MISNEYDAAGRRTLRTDQDGNIENYAYDSIGRLDRMTDGASTLIVDYDYDSAGRWSRKVLGNGVYTTYVYDNAGNVTNLVNFKPDNAVLSRYDYSYDISGRRTSMSLIVENKTPPEDLTSAITYLTNNASRMKYDEYRKNGLPITTSRVESTQKQINSRVKGTEKFWNDESLEPVLQVVSDDLSDNFDPEAFWNSGNRGLTAIGNQPQDARPKQ